MAVSFDEGTEAHVEEIYYWQCTVSLEYAERGVGAKTYPSFLTLKEGSTFLTKPLFPQGREDVTALRCSEPLRSKVGGPSKVFAILCGIGPLGDKGNIRSV